MPNGGPDNCGECRFNPRSFAHGAPRSPGLCEVRGIESRDPFYTYCANFHTRSREPDGPVYSAGPQHERLPWHGISPVWTDWSGAARPPVLRVVDAGRELSFPDAAAYLAWWRSMHPGESGEYPWDLHHAAFDPSRRAAGHDGAEA